MPRVLHLLVGVQHPAHYQERRVDLRGVRPARGNRTRPAQRLPDAARAVPGRGSAPPGPRPRLPRSLCRGDRLGRRGQRRRPDVATRGAVRAGAGDADRACPASATRSPTACCCSPSTSPRRSPWTSGSTARSGSGTSATTTPSRAPRCGRGPNGDSGNTPATPTTTSSTTGACRDEASRRSPARLRLAARPARPPSPRGTPVEHPRRPTKDCGDYMPPTLGMSRSEACLQGVGDGATMYW